MLEIAQGSNDASSAPYAVQEGNTLEGLAEALGVPEADLSALNPGLADELPPAGEEIILPAPAPEEADDAEPPAEGPVSPLGPPDILWDLPLRYPWQLPSLLDAFDPAPVPTGLLDMAVLEVDAPYDGVHCYVSAGDLPGYVCPEPVSWRIFPATNGISWSGSPGSACCPSCRPAERSGCA